MEASADLALVLLGIFTVGGLSLLAHESRKNRVAEILLLFAIVVLSLLVVALGAFVGLLGVIFDSDSPPDLLASSAVVIVLAGLAALALCVPPLRKVTGRRQTTSSYDAADRSSDSWWSDPPVFFALWMFVVVLTGNFVTLLAFTLTPGTVDSALTRWAGFRR